MKPFSTIAIPHSDILEGQLTMDVFAADLWQVFKGEAPEEYQNPGVFFRKTFLTAGIRNLLDIVKKRLDGKGGDPVIQLQTPFGGGKTHSLIALYHKAKEWKVNVVVIDGTALDPKDTTLWGEIEKQLTGEVNLLKGQTAPGREKLKNLLRKRQPLLILMDEILQYTTKSAGIKVGSSNLASQTIAFMQELTETVSVIPKSILVLTLPSSLIEHYDENAEKLFKQLQKVVGRMEKVFTPVRDEEIAEVIRRRLFNSINEREASEIIDEFLDYAEKERILLEGVEKSVYREKFKASFPFQPEVIDVLYKRWGSFPTFQRTRGVLRILALVVHSLKSSKAPFIRLADFDLENDDIRRELIKHIGQEFDSVIAADITSYNSGAKKVDKSLGPAYSSYSFGTKVATTIFMYSFSGGPEKGANVNEIKLSCSEVNIPSSIIVEAIDKLKENLYYLSDEGLFFTNQPNLNRILLDKMENIDEKTLADEEEKLLTENIKKKDAYFDVYLYPTNSKDIPDNKSLKLIILKEYEKCKDFFEKCGDKPRIYRNTIIFLCSLESERTKFEQFLKRKLAWQSIEKDKKLHLTDEQKERLKKELKRSDEEGKQQIRNLYRCVFLPAKEGLEEINLGIATYGIGRTIDEEIYETLKTEEKLVEKLDPSLIKKYLEGDKDYVETKNILESFYKTPGEKRITNEKILKDAIKEGVKEGLFGFGRIEKEKPLCESFKADCSPDLKDNEVIIKAELCEKIPGEVQKINDKTEEYKEDYKDSSPKIRLIHIKLKIPTGKLSDIVRMINNTIKSNFEQVDIKIEIFAQGGGILKSEYEDKIKETIKQTGAEIESEQTE